MKRGERSLHPELRLFPTNSAHRIPGPDAMYEYDLFAVINHEGQLDNGHYTNFARFQDEVGGSCGFVCVLTVSSGTALMTISMRPCVLAYVGVSPLTE